MSIAGPNPSEIQKLFASISGGYDKANDLMTFGMARLWRKQLVRWSGIREGQKALDVATGTGDLALEFKKAVGASGQVIGTDFCQEMFDFAPQKARDQNLDVDFQWADAMDLRFPNNSFDVVSIAYGIRNVADPIKAIEEMTRVTKPGGHIMILETGDQQSPWIQFFYNIYCGKIMPLMGHLVTGKKEAYQYLNKSSAKFPAGQKFCDILSHTTLFKSVEYKPLMAGASFLYKAQKVKHASRPEKVPGPV